MDTQTISIVTSVVALMLSLISIVMSFHSALASRAVSTERARGEVELLIEELKARNRAVRDIYRKHSDAGYGELEHLRNRLSHSEKWEQDFDKLSAKLARINSTGSAGRWLRIERLRNEVLLGAKRFDGVELEAKKIDQIITTD